MARQRPAPLHLRAALVPKEMEAVEAAPRDKLSSPLMLLAYVAKPWKEKILL
jgi:hypothetical protein